MEDRRKTHFGNKTVDVDEKKGLVAGVFDSVAGKYDLMNDLMSMGAHRLWKMSFSSMTGLREGGRAIDVAGGTADVALLLAERVGENGSVVVYDINADMLSIGRDKCVDKGYLKNITFTQGDAEAISFADNTFDCATIAFGIRNVTHIDKALREMTRVVKRGGRVVVLEFSHPECAAFSKLYDMYSENVLPFLGEKVTGNRDAYTYLHESIRKFPGKEEFKKMMEDAGLFGVRYNLFLNGIAAVHIGTKI